MLPPEVIRDSSLRKKIRRPFKKKYFGEHVYQTNVIGRCAVALTYCYLFIRDLNVVCLSIALHMHLCVSNVTFADKASHGWFFNLLSHSQDHHLDTDRFCRLNLNAKQHERRPMQSFLPTHRLLSQ